MIKEPDPQQPWAWGEYEMRKTLPPAELRGYNPIWISGSFLKNASVRHKKMVCGDGPFSLLYVDAMYIDPEAIKTIVHLAKEGLPVCLRQIPRQPGKNKSAEFGILLSELSGMKNVYLDFPGMSGIKPLVKGESLPDFWCRRELIFCVNGRELELAVEFRPYQSVLVRIGRQREPEFIDIY